MKVEVGIFGVTISRVLLKGWKNINGSGWSFLFEILTKNCFFLLTDGLRAMLFNILIMGLGALNMMLQRCSLVRIKSNFRMFHYCTLNFKNLCFLGLFVKG